MTFDRLLNWDRDTALAAAPQFVRLHPNWITTGSLVLATVGLMTLHLDRSLLGGLLGAALIFASRWVDWIDGYVARVTNRCSNLGGLYDIAVGYLTMVLVMVAIGLRQDDMALIWVGAGAAVGLRIVLMGVGYGLAKRQRLSVTPWNPQKLLTPRQRPAMRRIKWFLDACRNDYWIVLFACAGGTGLHAWAWGYTAVVLALGVWVLVATFRFLHRAHPVAPAPAMTVQAPPENDNEDGEKRC